MIPLNPAETKPQIIVAAIRALAAGGSNAVGECTLTPSAAITVVDFANCSETSKPILFPATAHAAAELAAGTMYVSAVGQGQFTIVHANNAQNDRTFYFVTLG